MLKFLRRQTTCCLALLGILHFDQAHMRIQGVSIEIENRSS